MVEGVERRCPVRLVRHYGDGSKRSSADLLSRSVVAPQALVDTRVEAVLGRSRLVQCHEKVVALSAVHGGGDKHISGEGGFQWCGQHIVAS